MKIVEVKSSLFQVPLVEVLTDAKHGAHTHFELVTVTVTRADGQFGTGYTYTGGKGGHAIKAMIDHDLAPAVVGSEAEDVEGIHDANQWHVHYVGRGGIASFAPAPIAESRTARFSTSVIPDGTHTITRGFTLKTCLSITSVRK